MANLQFDEKYTGISQKIGNPDFKDNIKGDFLVYLENDVMAEYKGNISHIINDFESIDNKDVEGVEINGVTKIEEGFEISYGDSSFVIKSEYGITPEKGDIINLQYYGESIEKIQLNGKVIFEETRAKIDEINLKKSTSKHHIDMLNKKRQQEKENSIKEMKKDYENFNPLIKEFLFAGKEPDFTETFLGLSINEGKQTQELIGNFKSTLDIWLFDKFGKGEEKIKNLDRKYKSGHYKRVIQFAKWYFSGEMQKKVNLKKEGK